MRSVTVDSIKYIFYSITQVVLASNRPSSITTQVVLASTRSSSITYWASITTSPDNTQLESILCVIKPTSFTTHIFNLRERNEKKSLASTSIKLKILKLGYLVR